MSNNVRADNFGFTLTPFYVPLCEIFGFRLTVCRDIWLGSDPLFCNRLVHSYRFLYVCTESVRKESNGRPNFKLSQMKMDLSKGRYNQEVEVGVGVGAII